MTSSATPGYRWLAEPVAGADGTQAHRANALSDARRWVPESGDRLHADVAHDAGPATAERTARRIGSGYGGWSVSGEPKAEGKARGAGSPSARTASETAPPPPAATSCMTVAQYL